VLVKILDFFKDNYGLLWILGGFRNGIKLRIYCGSYYDDLYNLKDHSVDLLILAARDPYFEYLEIGDLSPFKIESEYYTLESARDFYQESNSNSRRKFGAILSGSFIEKFSIPKKWTAHIRTPYFLALMKSRAYLPAFSTDQGIFILDYSSHLEKKDLNTPFPDYFSIYIGRFELAGLIIKE